MEDWLSQLEMEWNNEDMTLNNDLYVQYLNDHPEQGMHALNEELTLILGEDFPPPLTPERTTLSKVPSNLSLSSEHFSPPNCNLPQQYNPNNELVHQSNKQAKQQDGNGKRKRKREPKKIYDHIIAERKRRELLGQLFIALSAILPGLKKVDKTSILGEAIKHLKQLNEKVKTLEEAVAKQNVESMIMVKRLFQEVVNNDDDSSCNVDDNCVSGGSGGGDGGGGGGYMSDSLPEIEAQVSNKTLLLRLYCEKRKGISAQICAEVEKHDFIILNSNIAPFGVSAFNVTIVAETDKTDKKHVKNLVKNLHSIIRV